MGAPTAGTSYVDLANVSSVKLLLGISSTDYDVAIGALVSTVSRDAARVMNRYTKLDQRTEFKRVRASRRTIAFAGAPIVIVNSLRVGKTKSEASTSNPLVANTDFLVNEDLATIALLTMPGFLTEGALGRPIVGYAYARVDYTGGLGATADDIEEEYGDIAGAIARQTAYLYQRSERKELGTVSSGTGGGAFTKYEGAVDWLPDVKKVLEAYEREDFS